jgi:hypothetical protein
MEYGGVHDGLLSFTKLGGAVRPLLESLLLTDGGDEKWVRRLQLRLADCSVFSAAQLQARHAPHSSTCHCAPPVRVCRVTVQSRWCVVHCAALIVLCCIVPRMYRLTRVLG